MRLTLPNRYDFGADRDAVGDNLRSPERWDRLRLETAGPFSIDAPPVVAYADRARAIARLSRHVASYGCGTGQLERCLAAEGVRVEATDYAPRTVARLREMLPLVYEHDLTADGPLRAADLHLFHRIDTDLSNRAWRDVFSRFGRMRVLVVPGGLVRLPEVRAALRRRGTRTGWLRTERALVALWHRTHRGSRVNLAGIDGWLLEPRG